MSWLLHWLAVHTGSLNTAGTPPNYNFWSGFGSDIQEFGIFALLLGTWRRVNCHVRRCPRIGRVPVEGSPFHVCWRHSPEGKPTHRHILARHREDQAAKGATR